MAVSKSRHRRHVAVVDVDVQSDRIVLMVAIAELERQTTLYCSLYITFHPRRVRVTCSCYVLRVRVSCSCIVLRVRVCERGHVRVDE